MDVKAPVQAVGTKKSAYPGWLKVGFWICLVIAVGVVLRRVVALAHPNPGGTSPTAALDAFFASHAALTLAHILPALVFVLLTDGLLAPWRKRDRRCNRKSFKFASELASSWRQPVSIFENRPKIIAEPGLRFPQRRPRAATPVVNNQDRAPLRVTFY